MSESFKAISLVKIKNLEEIVLLPTFSLKLLPDFKNEFCKHKVRGVKKIISFFDFGTIRDIYRQHLSFSHQNGLPENDYYLCRLLFQALTGVRVESTYNLKYNSSVIKKICKCDDGCTCTFPTSNCFPRLKIHKTKTSAVHECPLIYSIFPCFCALSNTVSDDLVKATNRYNIFLKNHFNKTSHSLRKMLPNMVKAMTGNNTGAWQNENTLQKYYAHHEYKYIFAYTELQKLT